MCHVAVVAATQQPGRSTSCYSYPRVASWRLLRFLLPLLFMLPLLLPLRLLSPGLRFSRALVVIIQRGGIGWFGYSHIIQAVKRDLPTC
eukprot:COSAG06_NODE_267_length_18822_cov_26.254607_13_plen_89_part_00